MKLYICLDHDGFWPVGTASIVLAEDEAAARTLLDDALIARGLKPSQNEPYTLQELSMDDPLAVVLKDGEY